MQHTNYRFLTILFLIVLVLSFGAGGRPVSAQTIEASALDTTSASVTRVSVSSSNDQGNNYSNGSSISADGRFVAFWSLSSNLVSGDTNGVEDIFVHDRQTGETTRVSVSSSNEQGNGNSSWPYISYDGRFVAFESDASNLVDNDTNAKGDIFVHDRQTGETTRVSVSSAGAQATWDSHRPTLSADGQIVAFHSYASNLVSNDTNASYDIIVHDRQTGVTTRVSVSSAGVQGNSYSKNASISADGRFVAFDSNASTLVSNDTNNVVDAFVHDRQTGETRRVSVSSSGEQAIAYSEYPSISADGRWVAFGSGANYLVDEDDNGFVDVYVHDLQTGQTLRVSVSSSGEQGNGTSQYPSISADGRFVAFESWANNLASGNPTAYSQMYVHDRQTGQTRRLSVSSGGASGNSYSFVPYLSADGRFAAFVSIASNLVDGDTNIVCDNDEDGVFDENCPDVFVSAEIHWTIYLPLTRK